VAVLAVSVADTPAPRALRFVTLCSELDLGNAHADGGMPNGTSNAAVHHARLSRLRHNARMVLAHTDSRLLVVVLTGRPIEPRERDDSDAPVTQRKRQEQHSERSAEQADMVEQLRALSDCVQLMSVEWSEVEASRRQLARLEEKQQQQKHTDEEEVGARAAHSREAAAHTRQASHQHTDRMLTALLRALWRRLDLDEAVYLSPRYLILHARFFHLVRWRFVTTLAGVPLPTAHTAKKAGQATHRCASFVEPHLDDALLYVNLAHHFSLHSGAPPHRSPGPSVPSSRLSSGHPSASRNTPHPRTTARSFLTRLLRPRVALGHAVEPLALHWACRLEHPRGTHNLSLQAERAHHESNGEFRSGPGEQALCHGAVLSSARSLALPPHPSPGLAASLSLSSSASSAGWSSTALAPSSHPPTTTSSRPPRMPPSPAEPPSDAHTLSRHLPRDERIRESTLLLLRTPLREANLLTRALTDRYNLTVSTVMYGTRDMAGSASSVLGVLTSNQRALAAVGVHFRVVYPYFPAAGLGRHRATMQWLRRSGLNVHPYPLADPSCAAAGVTTLVHCPKKIAYAYLLRVGVARDAATPGAGPTLPGNGTPPAQPASGAPHAPADPGALGEPRTAGAPHTFGTLFFVDADYLILDALRFARVALLAESTDFYAIPSHAAIRCVDSHTDWNSGFFYIRGEAASLRDAHGHDLQHTIRTSSLGDQRGISQFVHAHPELLREHMGYQW
jgi:hypothetical protein